MDNFRHTRVFKNLGRDLNKWLQSKEVHRIAAIERQFYSSPEGKKLIKEWHEFGAALNKGIQKTKTGIHIDNKVLNGEIKK